MKLNSSTCILLVLTMCPRFIVQLETGCGSPQCTTTTCFTFKIRCLPRQARKYTNVTARALAVELAASADPNMYICPDVTDAQVSQLSVETQQKTDPKSVVQQLFNTKAFGEFQAAAKLSTGESRDVPDRGGIPRPNIDRLTLHDMMATKSRLADLKLRQRKGHPFLGDVSSLPAIEMVRTAGIDKLVACLSNVRSLTHSFDNDCTLEILDSDHGSELPAIGLDRAFRGWPSDVQVSVFDSLWLALDQWTRDFGVPVQQDNSHGTNAYPTVVNIALHALTASIPRAQRDTWHVVWSTIVNGRAYGKQRYRKSDVFSSPWLHILDAFESEPGLRLARRLTQVIASWTRLEEYSAAHRSSEDSSGAKPSIRAEILCSLIDEEQKVRMAKFGSRVRLEQVHGKSILGTTTLLWLEWLRKCFLKNWDGTFRLDRWGVAGTALELMEDICKTVPSLEEHALNICVQGGIEMISSSIYLTISSLRLSYSTISTLTKWRSTG